MNAPRFPLTQLPVKCAINVLRTMSPLQLVLFSLLSKKCKNQASSLKTPTEPMTIHFARGLVISIRIRRDILRIGFYESNAQERRNKKQLKTPKEVSLAIKRDGRFMETFFWETNRVELREWLETLHFILPDSNGIWMNFVAQSFQFDLDPIKELFPKIHKLSVTHTGSYAFNQSVLQKFLPVETITISLDCFENSRISHNYLLQNFNFTGLSVEGVLPHITLNELLTCNSKEISLEDPNISSKELNRFLKLWINGANPRLEFLAIFKTNGINYNIEDVKNGIRCQIMPRSLKRGFKRYQESEKILGGMDFYRKDGTKATIGLANHVGPHCFLMMIWHDHCIAP